MHEDIPLKGMREARRFLEVSNGVLRLKPTWVPKHFGVPGSRIGLKPEDANSRSLGPIVERWIASTVTSSGSTKPEEGLSYVVLDGCNNCLITLRDLIRAAGEELLGREVYRAYADWPVLGKLLDYWYPIPFHLHHRDEHARLVNKVAKPEAYYYPPELNAHQGPFPYLFIGLSPGTSPEDIRKCLEAWDKGDNGVLYLSQAYKQRPGTGWLVPPGILHSPGTLVTFELQRASDINAFYQSVRYDGVPIPKEMLFADFPPERRGDLEYALELIDWKENLDPLFKVNHYLEPLPAEKPEETMKDGYISRWVIYGHDLLSARELRLKPKAEVILRDKLPFVVFDVQGYGEIDGKPLESARNVSLDDLTYDEYFIAIGKAQEGVKVVNRSPSSELVLIIYGPEGLNAPRKPKRE